MAPQAKRIKPRPGPSRTEAETAAQSGRGKAKATRQNTSWSGILTNWRLSHRQNAAQSLRRLLFTPLQTMLTALVMAIALALPSMLYLITQSMAAGAADLTDSASISIYLSENPDQDELDSLLQNLNEDPRGAEIIHLSPDQALAEFQQATGLGDALTLLDKNPLPGVILVTPAEGVATDNVALQSWIDELNQQSITDEAALDMLWLQRLQSLLRLADRLLLVLGLILGLGVVLAMGNTIRLAIENRRDEIVIVKLVGASDGYVRRPFLYSGAWYGFFSGVTAWVLVFAGALYLSGPVDHLAQLYQSQFSLRWLSVLESAFLIGTATLLGWLGAWLAVARQLSTIEPT